MPLTRLELAMTRFFPLIFETFHAQRLGSLTTPGAISPETRIRLVFQKSDNLGTMPGARENASDQVAIGF